MNKKNGKLKNVSITIFIFIVSLAMTSAFAFAQDEDAQALVDKSRIAFNSVINDQSMAWLKENLKNSKGVLVVPSLIKGGFVVGGSGGSGVLLVQDAETGKWTYPGFYTLASATVGFQIGGSVSEVIMLVRTQRGLEKLLSTSFKLGGDASIAAGPVGAGASAVVTADIVSFTKDKGAYAGVSLEGSMVKTKNELNNAYYGQEVRPADIFILNKVSNPGADALIKTVADASKKSGQ